MSAVLVVGEVPGAEQEEEAAQDHDGNDREHAEREVGGALRRLDGVDSQAGEEVARRRSRRC